MSGRDDAHVQTKQPKRSSFEIRRDQRFKKRQSQSFDMSHLPSSSSMKDLSKSESEETPRPAMRTRAQSHHAGMQARTSMSTLRKTMLDEAARMHDLEIEDRDKLGVLLSEVVTKMRDLDLPIQYNAMRLVVHQDGAWIEEDGGSDSDNDGQSPKMRRRMEADLKCEVREHCPCICCWDEEDDGLPPFCRNNEDFETTLGIPCCKCLSKNEEEPPVAWWKLLNGHHRLTNQNAACWLFGTIGIRIFDRRRKTFMAIAMWSTLLSITFTVYGIAAFSTEANIVKATYWVWIAVENTTDGTVSLGHMGLNSMLVESDPCTALECHEENLLYAETGSWNKQAGSVTDFYRTEFKECRATMEGELFGLVLTCCALGFALLGASNRMRFKADFHIQKALGLVTDTIGAVSLFIALVTFWFTCYYTIPVEDNDLRIVTHLGPGYYGYVVCFFGAFMRAFFHWLTPTPKEWKKDSHVCSGGCCGGLNEMEIPEDIKEVLDHDEDGYISCGDVLYFLSHLHEDVVEEMFNFSDEARLRIGDGAFSVPRIDINLPSISNHIGRGVANFRKTMLPGSGRSPIDIGDLEQGGAAEAKGDDDIDVDESDLVASQRFPRDSIWGRKAPSADASPDRSPNRSPNIGPTYATAPPLLTIVGPTSPTDSTTKVGTNSTVHRTSSF